MNATLRYLDHAASLGLNVATVRTAYAECRSRSQRRFVGLLLRAVRADFVTRK